MARAVLEPSRMNTKSRFCTRLVPLVIVTAVAGVLCGAQLLAVDFTQFDRVDVTVVNVDVVVTDRQGNPIPGLKATDFVLLENGEEVEISHFTAYSRGWQPAPASRRPLRRRPRRR